MPPRTKEIREPVTLPWFDVEDRRLPGDWSASKVRVFHVDGVEMSISQLLDAHSPFTHHRPQIEWVELLSNVGPNQARAMGFESVEAWRTHWDEAHPDYPSASDPWLFAAQVEAVDQCVLPFGESA